MTKAMAVSRPRAALLAAVCIVLGAAPAAHAATASVEGDVVRVVAAPGEANQLTLTSDLTLSGGLAGVAVYDAGAPIVPGPGCTPADFGVTCATAGPPAIDVDAGDLGDSVIVAGSAAARLVGGDGDDRLTGGDGADILLGGTGSDFADGGAGADSIEVRDRLVDSAWCGDGRDAVTAEVLDFLDTACERVDYGRAGAVGRLRARRAPARWAAIPGQTWARVDNRILPGVLYLVRRYHVRITEGYATVGHTRFGEHPLGLAVDIEPGPGGTWADVARLARWAEPRQNRPRLPFRWVGWNGDVNHGHPSICKPRRGCAPHLHLSWSHTPARSRRHARTVWVFEVR